MPYTSGAWHTSSILSVKILWKTNILTKSKFLLMTWKNIFKCQPQRHCHYIDHLKTLNIQLANLPMSQFKHAREYTSKMWNTTVYTWFFFKSETSNEENVNRVRKALTDWKMNFILESTLRIQHTLTKLEGNEPFAPMTHIKISDRITYLSKVAAKLGSGEKKLYLSEQNSPRRKK